MITVNIGRVSREWTGLDDVEEGWIAQQVIERRRASQPVCVIVGVSVPGIDVSMVAGECSGGGGGGRLPNEDERRILELWRDRVSNGGRVDQGEIIAFFKQLRRLI